MLLSAGLLFLLFLLNPSRGVYSIEMLMASILAGILDMQCGVLTAVQLSSGLYFGDMQALVLYFTGRGNPMIPVGQGRTLTRRPPLAFDPFHESSGCHTRELRVF